MKKIFVFVVLVLTIVWFQSNCLAKTLKFVVLSDNHYAVDGEDKGMKMLASGKKILPKILKGLNGSDDIDFIVFTGDLLVDPFYANLKALKALLDKTLTKPYYVIPGNHDRTIDRDLMSKERFPLSEFIKVFSGHPYIPSGKSYWSMDHNGFHLIGLDTTSRESWGGIIYQDQLDWLKKDLRRNRNKFTIVFAHHALVEFYPERDLRKQFFIENYREVQDILFKNPQVKFVVSGHYHFSAAILKDGIHHLSMPSIITYPCKYAVITASGDEVKFETVDIDNPRLVRKARLDMVKAKDWRQRFVSDAHLVNLFKGIKSYSFEPRVK